MLITCKTMLNGHLKAHFIAYFVYEFHTKWVMNNVETVQRGGGAAFCSRFNSIFAIRCPTRITGVFFSINDWFTEIFCGLSAI